MKITAIGTYGTITFGQDGEVDLDDWVVSTDPPDARHVPADELALMLFQYLADHMRDGVLLRLMNGYAGAPQFH